MSTPCRLLLDPPASGAWNMAVDEALLDSVVAGGSPVLRFYGWSEPTLSLGYFQSVADRTRHSASAACPLVRRPTGGGAILHDRELTYCLIAPHIGRASPVLYERVHRAMIEVLAESGFVGLRLAGSDTPPSAAAGEKPFLCFQDITPGDLVAAPAEATGELVAAPCKVAGRAQRRRRGAVMQHGSLLLARSIAAPELPGLAELVGYHGRDDLLTQRLAAGIAAALGWSLLPGELSDTERATAGRLVESKYGHRTWNSRR